MLKRPTLDKNVDFIQAENVQDKPKFSTHLFPKILSYSQSALSILATTDKDRLQRGKICSKTNHDPPNPITNENIYAWYLTVSFHW